MICSSVNRTRLHVHLLRGDGLYPFLEELPGLRSLPQTAPYTVALEITHFLGTKGIEVIGATKSEKHAVP